MLVKLADSTEEKEKVYQLRYKVYIEEMNREQLHCDHKRKMIYEPMDDTGYIYAAFNDDGEAIATIRTNYVRDGNIDNYFNLYKLNQYSESELYNSIINSKLIIDKRHRSSVVIKSLVKASYEQGLDAGIEYDFIDSNAWLVRFYERIGYKTIDMIMNPLHGEVNLMKLEGRDIAYLKEIKSILYPILAAKLGQA